MYQYKIIVIILCLPLCCAEFLSKCATVYSTLTKRTPARGKDAVVVPTSEELSKPEEGLGEQGGGAEFKGVNATHYRHSLKSVIDQTTHE